MNFNNFWAFEVVESRGAFVIRDSAWEEHHLFDTEYVVAVLRQAKKEMKRHKELAFEHMLCKYNSVDELEREAHDSAAMQELALFENARELISEIHEALRKEGAVK